VTAGGGIALDGEALSLGEHEGPLAGPLVRGRGLPLCDRGAALGLAARGLRRLLGYLAVRALLAVGGASCAGSATFGPHLLGQRDERRRASCDGLP